MNETDELLSCDECKPGHEMFNQTDGTRACMKVNCTGDKPVFMIHG
jgi:hypothetical protein